MNFTERVDKIVEKAVENTETRLLSEIRTLRVEANVEIRQNKRGALLDQLDVLPILTKRLREAVSGFEEL